MTQPASEENEHSDSKRIQAIIKECWYVDDKDPPPKLDGQSLDEYRSAVIAACDDLWKEAQREKERLAKRGYEAEERLQRMKAMKRESEK